jgi:pimeloyl-ACP methyl ester carboxylesterase
MRRESLAPIALLLASAGVATAQPALPPSFRAQTIMTEDGTGIFVRVGGAGPPVVLLHGYGETSDMWGPLAAELARTRTVVVPDLRGLGRSSRPATGYDKATEARDVRAVLRGLDIRGPAAIVGHDLGAMVAYAYAAQFPADTERLVVMDAPIPGLGPWDEIIRSRALWHFSFGGPDAERLVAGRERIYLDRLWNEFSSDPAKIDEATRRHYAESYAQPGAMRAGFAQFAAFDRDALDNRYFAQTRLTMPVLAMGGEKSFGATMPVVMQAAATDVRPAVVPGAGHWLMEENPEATIALLRGFLAR